MSATALHLPATGVPPSTLPLPAAWPRPAVAWRSVAVLLAAYTLAYVDRAILTILVEPIQRDLGLNDTQLALLHGLAFVVFYVALGVPLGLLADRGSRKRLIAWSIVAWSVLTVACGFARSFGQLFAARIGVGVGEAGLSPASYSLIGDLFPPERRSAAIGAYMVGIYAGGGAALLLGGLVVQAVGSTPSVVLPLLGEMRSWQVVFMAVGLPGLLVAVLASALTEPQRRTQSGGLAGRQVPAAAESDQATSVNTKRAAAAPHAALAAPTHAAAATRSEPNTVSGGMTATSMSAQAHGIPPALGARPGIWQQLRRHPGAYGLHFLGFGLLGIPFNVTLLWARPYLTRHFGLHPPQAAYLVGTLMLVFCSAGVLCGSWLADALQTRGRTDAAARVALLAAIGAGLPLAAYSSMPTVVTTACVLAIVLFFGAFAYGAGPAVLQRITPNRHRAVVSAIYLLFANLVGLTIAPTLSGALTDYVFHDKAAIGLATSIVGAGGAALAALCFIGLAPRLRKAIATEQNVSD